MGEELGPTVLETATERTSSPRLVEHHCRGRSMGYEVHTSAREQPAVEPTCRAKPLAVGFDSSGLVWALHVGGLKDSLCTWADFTLAAQTGFR